MLDCPCSPWEVIGTSAMELRERTADVSADRSSDATTNELRVVSYNRAGVGSRRVRMRFVPGS